MKHIIEKIFPNKEDWSKTGIYKLYFSDNPQKIYLGSAVQTILYGKTKTRRGFYGRLYFHIWALKNNKHHSPKLQNFVNNHGLDNLRFEIIEFCDKTKSKEREELLIKELDCVRNGFNCSHEGHTNGATLSTETRLIISKKVSAALKGRIPKNFESIKGKRAKKVLEFKNGIIVNEYNSLIEMCTINKLSYQAMSDVLIGKMKLQKRFVKEDILWKYKIDI